MGEETVELKLDGIIKGIDNLFAKEDVVIESPYVISISGETGTLKSTICEAFIDKELNRNEDGKVLYITFEQTKESLARTMKKLDFFENKPGGEMGDRFEVWDFGRVVKKHDNLLEEFEVLLKEYTDKSYKKFGKRIRKDYSEEEYKDYRKYVLLKKAYNMVVEFIEEKGFEVKPSEARKYLTSKNVPRDFTEKVWPKGAREPEEPKATINYSQALLDVIEEYKEEFGEDFYLVGIDSLHAIFLKTKRALRERGKGHREAREEAKDMMYDLLESLHDHEVIVFMIAEAGELEEDLLKKTKFLSDGSIHLSREEGQRFIEIEKLREIDHEHDRHVLKLEEGKGLDVRGKG